MPQFGGKHAVVIGGSIAGLLAGRILAEHFDYVTILERDQLPDDGGARKGAPQGLHSHIMLKAGELVIAKWFPDFYEELNASGEVPVIDSADINWFHYGVWRLRVRTGMPKTLMTRPYFEWKIREKLVNQPNVTIRQQCEVAGLIVDESGNRVTGVKIGQKGKGKMTAAERHSSDVDPDAMEHLSADLVVDASGRGSQTPNWLEAIGFPKPEEAAVKIDIGYSTRLYEPPKHKTFDWQFLLVYPKAPYGSKIGFVQAIEHNRWIVTLAGCVGDYPPNDEDGFLEYAKQLDRPDVYEAIKDAKPLTPIKIHRFPASLRRRYEKLSRFPDGLLVVGDAVSSFNPVYGQGMSVTAMGVNALDECLQEQAMYNKGNLAGLHRRYFRKVAKIVDAAWLAAVTEDFRYPQAQGPKPFGTKLLNWYMGKLFELASVDQKIYFQVILVQNLVASPRTLFSPYIIRQVLKSNFTKTAEKENKSIAVEMNKQA
ncbi:hypothetical protein LOK74_08815 [Brevibacillus humidisoli]|uniref:NAD(P)/FAD-dependent oxidoreductase n=1 Tax=Brevibacillus humidisoli TaxID=2895522 RepID=UPI001E352A67|nr:hypothetical protein [Brevibacillus humidisoli]UFJ42575.1 hypothetical protein LOK74_08815 [Brevibacillus humidisoli]